MSNISSWYLESKLQVRHRFAVSVNVRETERELQLQAKVGGS